MLLPVVIENSSLFSDKTSMRIKDILCGIPPGRVVFQAGGLVLTGQLR
jgi:hypothetical protein